MDKDWLQNWLLLATIANTTRAIIDWVTSLRSSPAVLTCLDDGVQSYSPALSRSIMVESLGVEEVMLIVLLAFLIVVLVLRRRTRRSTS